jgi:hypothetical protein
VTLDQNEQIAALAKAMSTIPGLDPTKGRTPVNAAVRGMWAAELVTKWGVSIDPELATVEAVSATEQFGNLGPHNVVDKVTEAEREAANALVRNNASDFLSANNPTLAARLAAAKTPQQRHALAEELRGKILSDPNTLVTDFVQLLQDAPQEGEQQT